MPTAMLDVQVRPLYPVPRNPPQRAGCGLTRGRQLQDELARVQELDSRGEQRTQRPNLSGDVLELAQALRGRVGWIQVNSSATGQLVSQLAYHPAPASGGLLADGGQSAGGVWAYGDRAAQLQCLPHEELGALTHHHHARRAHGHSPGDFEHGVCAVAAVEWRVCGSASSSWVEALSQEQLLGARLRTSEDAGPEIAASLIGCVESKRSHAIAIAILTTSRPRL